MEEIKLQHPGFTIICDKCNGKNVVIDNSIGYSSTSGSWGSINLICNDCGNTTEIAEG